MPENPEQIDGFLSEPTIGVVETLQEHPGDVMVLGAGGKMGATTALMAAKGLAAVGRGDRVVAVSRFLDQSVRRLFEARGISTITADLLNRDAVARLPDSPALPLNVTGPEVVSVRSLAERFGRLFNKEPIITGTEEDSVWLNNAGESFRLFGYPTVTLDQMVVWTSEWIVRGGTTLGKPTNFEVRDGAF